MNTTIKMVRNGNKEINATFVDGDTYAMVYCSELSIAIVGMCAGETDLIKLVPHTKVFIARDAVSRLNRGILSEEDVASFVA